MHRPHIQGLRIRFICPRILINLLTTRICGQIQPCLQIERFKVLKGKLKMLQCEVKTSNDIKSSMTNNEFQFKIIKWPFFLDKGQNFWILSLIRYVLDIGKSSPNPKFVWNPMKTDQREDYQSSKVGLFFI